MAEPSNEPRIYRGLKDVYFERSETTFIDGKAGELRYRGYSIHDLAQNSCFEETAYLLINGELPTAAQLAAFDAELKAARVLPAEVLDVIRLVQRRPPDGRSADGGFGACSVRSGNSGHLSRRNHPQGRAAVVAGADDRCRA